MSSMIRRQPMVLVVLGTLICGGIIGALFAQQPSPVASTPATGPAAGKTKPAPPSDSAVQRVIDRIAEIAAQAETEERSLTADEVTRAFRIGNDLYEFGEVGVPVIRRVAGETPASLGPLPRTVVYRVLADLTADSGAADVLIDVVQSDADLQLRRAAADQLASVCSLAHESRLLRLLGDGEAAIFDSLIQISVARALWFACRETTVSNRTLRRERNSSLGSVRIEALLTMGELGLFDEVEEELRPFAQEPSDRGLRAQAILRQQRLREQLSRLLTELGVRDEGDRITDPEVDTRIIEEVILKVQRIAAVDTSRLTEVALLRSGLSRMLDRIDPYASLLPTPELAEVAREMLNRVGLPGGPEASPGIVLGNPGGLIRVMAVIDGSPAERAGIRPGDSVFEINGTDVLGSSLVEANHLIRDTEGTFTIELGRGGWSVPRTFSLEPAAVDTTRVRSTVLDDRVLLLRPSTLMAGTAEQVRGAITGFFGGTVSGRDDRAIVLDLRNNPGGGIEEAVKIAGLFLPADSLVAYSEGRNPTVAPRTEYHTTRDPLAPDTPLTILVDVGTSHTAELLAGSLRHYDRARILAEEQVLREDSDEVQPEEPQQPDAEREELGNTFGKGIVQQIVPLRFNTDAGFSPNELHGAAMKLTVGFWYLPSERRVHGKGLVADQTIRLRGQPGWVMDELAARAFVAARDEVLDGLSGERANRLTAGLAPSDDLWPDLAALKEQTGCKASLDWIRLNLRDALRRQRPEGVPALDPYRDLTARYAIQQAVGEDAAEILGLPAATAEARVLGVE